MKSVAFLVGKRRRDATRRLRASRGSRSVASSGNSKTRKETLRPDYGFAGQKENASGFVFLLARKAL